MSVAQFSALLQKHLVSRVSKAAKAKSAVKGLDIGDMRKRLGQFSSHDAVISEKGFDRLLEQLQSIQTGKYDLRDQKSLKYIPFSKLSPTEKKIVSGAIEKISKVNVNEFISSITSNKGTVDYLDDGYSRSSKVRKITSSDSGNTITTLENIPQNKLIDLLINYVSSAPYNASAAEIAFLKANLQAGHTAGVFNLKMLNTFGLLIGSGEDFKISGHSKRSINAEDQDQVVGFMNSVIKLLVEADRISSNMPEEVTLFAESVKKLGGRHPKASTEIQLAWLNKESGSTFIGLGNRIAGLTKAATDSSAYSQSKKQPEAVKSLIVGIQQLAHTLRAEYLALEGIQESIREELVNNIDKFVLEYVSTPSSPVFTISIAESIASNILTGKDTAEKVYNTKSPKVNTPIKKNKTDAAIKNAINSAVKLRNKLSQLEKAASNEAKLTTRLRKSSKLNLANLQALLNQALSHQIKENMEKPALENRTGRFAESVKVERLSESRAGMISAFYSYMKSPYQTFEPGYNQGSNQRNPKTLISKSIREIASGLVGNRLRAISL